MGVKLKYPEECLAYYCAESFSPGGDLRYLPPLMGSVYSQDLASVQLQGDSVLVHMGTTVEVTLYQDAFSHFDKEHLLTFIELL